MKMVPDFAVRLYFPAGGATEARGRGAQTVSLAYQLVSKSRHAPHPRQGVDLGKSCKVSTTVNLASCLERHRPARLDLEQPLGLAGSGMKASLESSQEQNSRNYD